MEGGRDGAAGTDLRTLFVALAAIVLLGAALRAMAVVLVPLVAAVLIALAVMPVRDGIQARVPAWAGWLGQAVAMALILLVLALFFGGIVLAARQIVGAMPQGEAVAGMLGGGQAAEAAPVAPGGAGPGVLRAAEDGAGAVGGQDPGTGEKAQAPAAEAGAEGPEAGAGAGEGGGAAGLIDALLGGGLPVGALRDIAGQAAGAASGVAAAILNRAVGLVAGLVLVFFLTLLILIESGEWRRKVAAIAAPRTRWRLTESTAVIAAKVRRYLVVQTALGAVTAALYAGWLWLWGVDLVLVWSLLTLLLVFIPTVGSLVAGLLPVAYTLVTQDVTHAIGVGAGLLVIEQVMGNWAEPRFQGRNIALSPLVILVALAFWTWAWGLAGALLAVPVTVALVVLGAHVPATRPWALLLSDQTDLEGLAEVTSPD